MRSVLNHSRILPRTSTRTWAGLVAVAMAFTSLGCGSVGDTAETSQAAVDGHNWKVLNIDFQIQQTGWWCGPTATRNALSARISPPSQQQLANQMGTTEDGTNSIDNIVPVLNRNLGGNFYASRWMTHDPPTAQERDQLWNDIVYSIDNNFGVVANIVAPPNNHPPGYPQTTIFHYIAVIGYNPDNSQVYVADSANFQGITHYWLSIQQMASLIPPKGYAYAVGGGNASTNCNAQGQTGGAIDAKYRALGGCNSVLGAPTSNEIAAPDGIGRYNVFEKGSIYWTQKNGAFEVHGVIRDKWKELGWETAEGKLGYPLSDEIKAPDGVGHYNVFERGSIYWTPDTGAHEVLGYIRDYWAKLGWESGTLGYPTSGEYDTTDGWKQSDFQYGSIAWNPKTDEMKLNMKR